MKEIVNIKSLTLIFLALGLQGCVGALIGTGAALYNSPSKKSEMVEVENDDFQKITTFKGDDVGGWTDLVFIRAWKPYESNDITYQIYISDKYTSDWRFYEYAYDSNGNKLDTTQINQKALGCSYGSCSHEEVIGLNVSRKYLDESINAGITIQLYGKNGREIFKIPGDYIGNFLKEIDTYQPSTM